VTKIQFDNRRAVEEWRGATPDAAIPARVKLRIFERCGGKCAITGKKLGVGEFDYDHIKRLRDGGEHRESNLHVVYRPAHREKTAEENSDGAKADKIRLKHLGLYPKSKTPLRSGNSFSRRGG
jgi:5-methylcytosine-specific restriction protein A